MFYSVILLKNYTITMFYECVRHHRAQAPLITAGELYKKQWVFYSDILNISIHIGSMLLRHDACLVIYPKTIA
jgi:hypothetical protein